MAITSAFFPLNLTPLLKHLIQKYALIWSFHVWVDCGGSICHSELCFVVIQHLKVKRTKYVVFLSVKIQKKEAQSRLCESGA